MKEIITTLIDEETIDARLNELGKQLSEEYAGKTIHMICVLKGGVMVMTELAKRITVPVTMDFMACSSYGSGTTSSGVIKIIKDLDEPLEGKDVLLVEDIVDTGRTLQHLIDLLWKRNPASLKLCTLLDKPTGRAVENLEADYSGFIVPDAFIVGYGLDYDQKYRNLPYIGVMSFEEE